MGCEQAKLEPQNISGFDYSVELVKFYDPTSVLHLFQNIQNKDESGGELGGETSGAGRMCLNAVI